MFELEEISSSYHDGYLNYLNKFADPSSQILDLYISDSMQDMLDIDIKSEVATVVGGANEFTSLMNYDLPSLEFDAHNNSFNDFNENSTGSSSSGGNGTSWLDDTTPKWSEKLLFSGHFLSGSGKEDMNRNSDLFGDNSLSSCVNPNSVMPASSTNTFLNKVLKTSTRSNMVNNVRETMNGILVNRRGFNTNLNEISVNNTASPIEKKSHLTFSPNTLKLPPKQQILSSSIPVQDQIKSDFEMDKKVNLIRKNLASEMVDHSTITRRSVANQKMKQHNTIELAVGINGLTFSNTQHSQNSISVNGNGNLTPKLKPLKQHQSTNMMVMQSGQRLNGTVLAQKHHNSSKTKVKHMISEFPKPAYSYSCLIAMALKNSRSGSLPVSEIYNFMCEHFPYFKTAPNGWKNSVRHNLSLNKCFEKIEKPATNGAQRKGCLWAMNPSKILKMDEEVQKWSKKDPMAIKKAMVHPEHLGALERGEMKHGHYDNDDDGEDDESGENDEDGDDLDETGTDFDSDLENDGKYRKMKRSLWHSVVTAQQHSPATARSSSPRSVHSNHSSPSSRFVSSQSVIKSEIVSEDEEDEYEEDLYTGDEEEVEVGGGGFSLRGAQSRLSEVLASGHDNLIAANGSFDIEGEDFYDEIDLDDRVGRKDYSSLLNNGIKLEDGPFLDDEIDELDLLDIQNRHNLSKRARLDVSIQSSTRLPTNSRRKMTLVNRIL